MKATHTYVAAYTTSFRRAPHTIATPELDHGPYADPDMRVCTLCGATGHSAAGCPWNRSLRSLAEDLH